MKQESSNASGIIRITTTVEINIGDLLTALTEAANTHQQLTSTKHNQGTIATLVPLEAMNAAIGMISVDGLTYACQAADSAAGGSSPTEVRDFLNNPDDGDLQTKAAATELGKFIVDRSPSGVFDEFIQQFTQELIGILQQHQYDSSLLKLDGVTGRSDTLGDVGDRLVQIYGN